MAWQAPIVAHVDRLGYLFCIQCRPELGEQTRDAGGYPVAVHGDIKFGIEDRCEGCSKQLEHVPTSKYVYVS